MRKKRPATRYDVWRDVLSSFNRGSTLQLKLFRPIASIAARSHEQWQGCTPHTTWFIPWVRRVHSKRKIGEPPRILQRLHATQAYSASSISAAWETKSRPSPPTYGAGTKLPAFCAPPAYPPSNSAPPS